MTAFPCKNTVNTLPHASLILRGCQPRPLSSQGSTLWDFAMIWTTHHLQSAAVRFLDSVSRPTGPHSLSPEESYLSQGLLWPFMHSSHSWVCFLCPLILCQSPEKCVSLHNNKINQHLQESYWRGMQCFKCFMHGNSFITLWIFKYWIFLALSWHESPLKSMDWHRYLHSHVPSSTMHSSWKAEPPPNVYRSYVGCTYNGTLLSLGRDTWYNIKEPWRYTHKIK